MTDNGSSQDAVVIERTFDAPVDLIWQMWTDPEHFKAWYGPDGAAIPVAKMDVRVGGTRLVCMEVQSPNGPMRMWFSGEYREVIENERLLYTESMSDENGNVSSPSDQGLPEGHPMTTEIRVELEDIGGRTRMLMTHVGIPGDSAGLPVGRWHSTSLLHTSQPTSIDSARCSWISPARRRRFQLTRHTGPGWRRAGSGTRTRRTWRASRLRLR